MTSRISFSKLVRDEMRKLNWLMAVQGLVLGLLIPFRTLLVMAVAHTNYLNEGTKTDLLEAFYNNVGLGRWENNFFILGLGILCALCAFSYVHAPAKLDFFHSLPIRREQLFAAKYVGSVLTFVIAYTVSQVLALLIGAVYGVCSAPVVFETLIATLEGILCFLCSYAGALLAVMLTGKMLTTILTIGTMGFYVPLIWLLQLTMRELFLSTAILQDRILLNTDILRYSSPWAFAMLQPPVALSAHRGLTGTYPSLALLCQMVAMAVIFSAAALALYRIRKTEAAGRALAFGRIEGVAKLMLTVPGAIVAAFAGFAVFDSAVWETFFIVLFGILGCMILEFIFRGDIRQIFQRKWHMVLTILLAAGVFFGFRYDVAGYNTYLPDKEELVGISVMDVFDANDYSTVVKNANDCTAVLDYLETDQIDTVYPLAENGVSNADVVFVEEGLSYINIKYHLNNGREVYRRYWVDESLYKRTMDTLLQDDSLRERYYPSLTWENSSHLEYLECSMTRSQMEKFGFVETEDTADDMEDSKEVYGTESSSGEILETVVHVSGEEMDQVLEAYNKDLRKLSYSERQDYEVTLMLQKKSGDSEFWPVTPEYGNTLSVLKELYLKHK